MSALRMLISSLSMHCIALQCIALGACLGGSLLLLSTTQQRQTVEELKGCGTGGSA